MIALRVILFAVGIVPILFLLIAYRKGWVSRNISANFQFLVVSFLAVAQSVDAIYSARVHGTSMFRASALVAALISMWLAAWQGRKKDRLNNPSQAAVLIGYIAVGLSQNP